MPIGHSPDFLSRGTKWHAVNGLREIGLKIPVAMRLAQAAMLSHSWSEDAPNEVHKPFQLVESMADGPAAPFVSSTDCRMMSLFRASNSTGCGSSGQGPMMRASSCMDSAGSCFSFSVCLTVLPSVEESRFSSPPEGVAVRDWRSAPSSPFVMRVAKLAHHLDFGPVSGHVPWLVGVGWYVPPGQAHRCFPRSTAAFVGSDIPHAPCMSSS